MKIGMIGAGFVARGLTALAVRQGHQVMLSNSRGPRSLYTAAAMLKSEVGTVAEAIGFGDMLVLAIPVYAYPDLPVDLFDGKLVIDAGNYHPHRDGQIAELDERQTSSSAMLAKQMPKARIVKAFNSILAPDLDDLLNNGPSDPPRALPIAGDDEDAKRIVADLHREFGLDPLDAGSLADSWRFETNKPSYCARLIRPQLIERLAMAERDVEWPPGHWDN